MSQATREPGEVFLDARGNGRALRLTWHQDADVVVLSLWRGHVCASTFRLTRDDVEDFIGALIDGLSDAPDVSSAHARTYDILANAETEVAPLTLPPPQRRPGAHAGPRTENRRLAELKPSAAQLRPVKDEQSEGFIDLAFATPGAHRATAS